MTDEPTSAAVTEDPLVADAQWRRLDLRMLLVHPVNEVLRYLPALVGVFLLGRSLDGDRWWHLAAVGVPVVVGLLRFVTTSYRITGGQLQLRRGMVRRAELTARLDRIRTVELTSSLIHRMLGLAKVEIGTAGSVAGGGERLRLDALPRRQAQALRAALLHRSPSAAGAPDAGSLPAGEPGAARGAAPAAATPASDGGGPEASVGSGVEVPVGAGPGPGGDDQVLLRLDPRWVRFAPLTTAGLVVAAAAAGASSQFAGPMVEDLIDGGLFRPGSAPAGLLIAGAVLAVVLAVSLLALLGYLLNYWGLTLSRDRAGRSLHVVRGLLTSRETSIEIARLRGVEYHEPLGLRLAGGARLDAIVTGLSRRDAGSAPVVPPAPREVADRLGAVVLGEIGPAGAPLSMTLTGHGPRAVRRRYQRALAAAAVLAAGWAIAVLLAGWTAWLLLAGLLPWLVAVPLAADRARRLGHALTPEYLVTRAHSLRGRRVVLLRRGIIGWNVRQTVFQRRAGLVTLTATTAAGKQGYRLYDVPEPDATALADHATPGLLTPFLVTVGD